MRLSQLGWTYPETWAISRERALHARQEYRTGAKLVDLMIRYKVGYGTMRDVIAGKHPSVRGLPNVARRKGPQ